MIDFETLKLGDKVFKIKTIIGYPERKTFVDENKIVWYRTIYKQRYFVEELEFSGKVEFVVSGEIYDEFGDYDQTKYYFRYHENTIIPVYIEDSCDIFYTIDEANKKAEELEKDYKS